MELDVLSRPAASAPLSPAAALATPAAQRIDLYTPIHKALRAFMSATLHAVGRMDAADDAEVAAALAQTRALLETCQGHLEKENGFVHPAMDARRPGWAARTAAEHVGHEQSIRELAVAVDAVEAATEAARVAAALKLYRHLALFVAENFEHMRNEETAGNALLWATHTDAELLAIHGALLAAIKPQEMALVLRWMIPALNHAERVEMLRGMRQGAPAPVFQGVLGIAREHLAPRDWDKLAAALA